jgi:Asp-tRNA(Asn)/Glu-tRNA(Gln) amidotransferase A subunit family amidase
MSPSTSYNLKSLTLPKMSGRSLRLFAAALDAPATRRLLLPGLLKQGGVEYLRTLRLAEDPTLYPFGPSYERALRPLSPQEVDAAFADNAAHGAPAPTIRDYASAYRQGSTTPEAVAERVLEAIAKSDQAQPPLRAFVANDRQDVLEQARRSGERLRAGHPLSLLDGVPVAIKDEIDMAPYPSHAGTAFLGTQPAEDCTPVARLRAAGALLIGKANMNELGLDTCGFNQTFGTARNPYQPQHDTGGSSSGPGAAVAAGFCPVAIGCDGGGSIRVPAAFCGVVGLKPSFGRVSEVGAVPLCPSVDAIGPLGVTTADVALAYGLIAGPDPRDPRSQFQPPVDLDGWNTPGLTGLTLGVYEPWFRHASPTVVAACEGLLAQLQAAGARLVPVEIADLDASRVAHIVTIISEQMACMRDRREQIQQLSAPARINLNLAHGFTSTDYVQAQRLRTRAIAELEEIFTHVDAIITPTTAVTAPAIPPDGPLAGWSDLSTTTEIMRFVFLANLTGHPAISFPAGYDSKGLPIGMQAIGRYWDETTLLRLAFNAEQVIERKKPQVFFPLL